MTIVTAPCCCAEVPTVGPEHERGNAHLWLRGNPAGIRRALATLLAARFETSSAWSADERVADAAHRYHGGVHVEGAHVVAVFDDGGSELYPHTAQFPSHPWSPWVRGAA